MSAPWTNLFLISLSVLIVVYAGNTNGDSFFSTVGKYMESAGEVIDDVVGGLEKVIAGVRTFENVLSDAIEADCEFTCKNGAKPKKNPYHKPRSNGCGSLGLQLEKNDLPIGQLTKCCDSHDICYDTCNNSKDDCDKDFKKCLYRICDKNVNENENLLLKKCKAAAKFMYVGIIALGCTPYKEAQKTACLCDKVSEKEL